MIASGRRLVWISGLFLPSVVILSGCDARRAPSHDAALASPAPAPVTPPPLPPSTPAASTDAPIGVEDQPIATEHGNATWYEVPRRSLAKRRAPNEYTAAHDRFPLGSYARVTNLENGRSVVVRITDRGIGESRTIDLCKEAAEEIGVVGKGVVKVKIDALRERPRNGT